MGFATAHRLSATTRAATCCVCLCLAASLPRLAQAGGISLDRGVSGSWGSFHTAWGHSTVQCDANAPQPCIIRNKAEAVAEREGHSEPDRESYLVAYKPEADFAVVTDLLQAFEGVNCSTLGSGDAGLALCQVENEAAIRRLLTAHPELFLYAEEDTEVHADAASGQDAGAQARIQSAAHSKQQRVSSEEWALDRIDQNDPPLDGIYSYSIGGAGVSVYVVDTGVRLTHEEFLYADGRPGSRVAPGIDTCKSCAEGDAPLGNDCAGHGTHVASLIGGLKFGAAKDVRIVPVRVLDCEGQGEISSVIAGIHAVLAEARHPAIVLLSLLSRGSPSLDGAVQRLLDNGITVVNSAGNFQGDACDHSPSRVRGVITVGATDQQDRLFRLTSTGPCVDLFAPGVEILGAHAHSDTSLRVLSGTSQAAPFAAAAAALYLEQHPDAPPAEVQRAVVMSGSYGRLHRVPSDTANLLLNTLNIQRAEPDPVVFDANTIEVISGKPEQLYPIRVRLSRQPSSDVILQAVDIPLSIQLQPPVLRFSLHDWNVTQVMLLSGTDDSQLPRPRQFNLNLLLTSSDEHSPERLTFISVSDFRGDSADNPLVINSLPLTTQGSTQGFGHHALRWCNSEQVEDAAVGGGDVVYYFRPTSDAEVLINTCGSDFDTKLHLFHNISSEAQMQNAAQVSCNDDYGSPECETQSLLTAELIAGVPYMVVVSGWGGATGDYVLRVLTRGAAALPGLPYTHPP